MLPPLYPTNIDLMKPTNPEKAKRGGWGGGQVVQQAHLFYLFFLTPQTRNLHCMRAVLPSSSAISTALALLSDLIFILRSSKSDLG